MPPTRIAFLLLLLLFLFAITATNGAHPPSTAEFLRSSCSATLYPILCRRSLAPFFPPSSRLSPRRAAFASLLVTLRHARAASSFASAISGRTPNPPPSLLDCASIISDSADQIRQSLHQMRHMGRRSSPRFSFSLSNVQTWTSAALTDLTTCLDGLDEDLRVGGTLKSAVTSRVVVVMRFTSNSLALINLVASPNRRA